MASWNYSSDGTQVAHSLTGSQPLISKNKKSRSRYNAASGYLQSALADFIKEDTGGKDHSKDVLEPDLAGALHGWRSAPASEVSSHLCQPKWHRLIRGVGSLLADQISRNVVDLKRQMSTAPFVSVDSPGGGSLTDVTGFLAVCLEAMGLSDKDTGYILIDAYHFLQADDLPLSSQTWRALLVTSLQAAAKSVLADSKDQMSAMAALQSNVAHWWTPAQASKAHKVFVQRENFKQLGPSQRADMYFELRDLALRMNYEEESNASAVNLMDSDPSFGNHSLSFQDLRPLAGSRKGLEENSLEISGSAISGSVNCSSIMSL